MALSNKMTPILSDNRARGRDHDIEKGKSKVKLSHKTFHQCKIRPDTSEPGPARGIFAMASRANIEMTGRINANAGMAKRFIRIPATGTEPKTDEITG